MRIRTLLPAISLSFVAVMALPAQVPSPSQNSRGPTAAPLEPRALYQALNDLRVNAAQVYDVQDVKLRRGPVSITLSGGKLAFFSPLQGRITGAVFVGSGHTIATPRDPAERRSIARFLDVPLLDQSFSRALFRFTDDTAEQLQKDLQESGATGASDDSLARAWDQIISNANPWQSKRILAEWLSTNVQPYFYAGLFNEQAGLFDVIVDREREEQVSIGQTRVVNGEAFYDTWASYPLPGVPQAEDSFAPVDYALDTTIGDDLSLRGRAALHLRALHPGGRVIALELSRYLAVDECTDAEGKALAFFQNDDMSRREMVRRGNDQILVVLSAPAQAKEEFHIAIHYHGSVISDAGNGVYYVGARGTWYPHLNVADQFAAYDLTFHWPRRLKLVATGNGVETHDDHGQHSGRWRSSVPMALAGFNLGDYQVETLGGESPKISLFASQQMEDALMDRIRTNPAILSMRSGTSLQRGQFTGPSDPPPPPSPAGLLKSLGASLLDSVRFFEKANGPFPFDHMDVSQVPNMTGQGWPGLLYLPTLVFLPSGAQQRVGANVQEQQELNDLMPFHEVAHQWWGNVCTPASYRDAWIQEAVANYLALWYTDSKSPSQHFMAHWLTHYRDELIAKSGGGRGGKNGEPVAEAGPLSLGSRLDSSRTPGDFGPIIYGKGSWVIHMLRMMLRDPNAADADARFREFLHFVLTEYRFKTLSNAELQKSVEKFMTPAMDLEGSRKMDWFFEDWVQGTAIPHYVVEFNSKAQGSDFLVTGKLKQQDTPEDFTAPVPLYAARTALKPVLLGIVETNGRETAFRFRSHVPVSKIMIDPNMTVLSK
jgi:Peptidase family M1 domain